MSRHHQPRECSLLAHHDPAYNPLVNPWDVAFRLLSFGPICDRCLGRGFAALPGRIPNKLRGNLLRAASGFAPVSEERCWVCGGVFQKVPEWAGKAASLVEGYEFSTFLFGVHLSPRLLVTEEFLAEEFPSPWAEPIRRELNRELGMAFERILALGEQAATVDFVRPDVRFTVDLERGDVELQVSSVLFFGRYRKLIRGIPQTHWPCPRCHGRGCPDCQGTGRLYPTSVEELILPAFIAATGGRGGRMHGAGREDIDARMLGRGRPFVVEIDWPRRRTIDLGEVAEEVQRQAQGAVEVLDLRPASPDLLRAVKSGRADKRYRARVAFATSLDPEEFVAALNRLVGEVEQRTPTRVRHRRADLVRRRRVHTIQGQLLSPTEAEVEILCEAGLYVKELISGDEGNTRPSLAGLLGQEVQVTALDVLEVLDELDEHFVEKRGGG